MKINDINKLSSQQPEQELRAEYDFKGAVREKHYCPISEGYTIQIHKTDGTTETQKLKKALNEKDSEVGEEQLAVLIKQAGHEARMKKNEAMAHHFNKLRAVIEEALSHKQGPLSI